MSEFEARTGAPEDPPEAQRPAAEEGFSTLERTAEAEARDDRMAAAWEAASMKREMNRQRVSATANAGARRSASR